MKLVVAATGGVAALKTPSLVRRLAEAGHDVAVAATDDALHFVTRLSLAVAAGTPVFDRDAWFTPDGHARHIELARWADALVVAPATADALASAAHGRGDDVVSALILAGIARVIWAPAMNTAMWEHPATKTNVASLESYGHYVLGPAEGTLAAKGEGAGVGRMLEPEQITRRVGEILLPTQDLAAEHVLVSAGPTREYLDPVRFLSNPSSGKMGYAVAAAAIARGATVTLVSGPTGLEPPPGARVIYTESAEEMCAALARHFGDATMLVMSAAVADWRPAERKTEKEPKQGDEKTLVLVRTPDILETLAARKTTQVMVGFAMETDQGVARAADKARRKQLDFICLNYPGRSESAFGSDTNRVTIVTADGEAEALPLASKRDVAGWILDRARGVATERR
ncbi:MAG: bifunctional phosphopantothenoylcysteine decarboxylase/phosphopantothenate--cysteine ligase CoaBC [Trueperaceae bacterium]|nr:bifunctional phosphopantothenoylcysteine decarboxylase/phosphopantothenate--cysteine ligase CoaBC [Trueperaceae bacterium]